MKASKVSSFLKTALCPSSSMLLMYRSNTLPPGNMALVRHHMETCDFCSAELPLLAHYTAPSKAEFASNEIPINLRILAESLLHLNPRIPETPREGKPEQNGVMLTDV